MRPVRESDILHEAGPFWVADLHDSYAVWRAGLTHSSLDSAYRHDPDGLSLAMARCRYLAVR